MSKCQYLFKNGTLCGTNSYNQIYCDGHTVIVLQDRITALESALTAERVRADTLAAALEFVERQYLRAFRSGIDDKDWFEYFQPIADKVKAALAAHQQARGE